jgi:hypothetical protein
MCIRVGAKLPDSIFSWTVCIRVTAGLFILSTDPYIGVHTWLNILISRSVFPMQNYTITFAKENNAIPSKGPSLPTSASCCWHASIGPTHDCRLISSSQSPFLFSCSTVCPWPSPPRQPPLLPTNWQLRRPPGNYDREGINNIERASDEQWT